MIKQSFDKQRQSSERPLVPTFVVIFCTLLFLLGAFFNISSAEQQRTSNLKETPGADEHSSDISISTVSILLPHDPRVHFIVDAFNGCFKWSVSREGVVDVKVLDPCGNKVIVRAAPGVPAGRQSVWMIGEHMYSGRLLKCEVYVDHLVRLEIATTTRTMYKGDVEMLEVYGFDQEGNQFSSLQGLEFEWTIRPDTDSVSSLASSASSQTILKFVRFRDSPIEVNEVVLRLETEGKQTSVVLVQGIDTGRVRVTSRLLHYVNPLLQQLSGVSRSSSTLTDTTNIPPASVIISVREPLLLQPTYPIYILPHTTVQYTLYTYTRDALRPLDVSALQSYRWRTSNTSVAEVNTRTGLLWAKAFGFTHVIVQYVDLEESSAQGDVHVVDAMYLGLRIVPKLLDSTPEQASASNISTSTSSSFLSTSSSFLSTAGHDNWCLIINSTYLLEVEAYDRDHHKLYSTDELRFNVSLSAAHFRVVNHSANFARFELVARQEGHTEIVAAVVGYRTPRTAASSIQTVRADVRIVPPIQLVPPDTVTLAWHNESLLHEYSVHAVGGSGQYEWYIANHTVAAVRPTATSSAVTTHAHARIVALGQGSTFLRSSDFLNSFNQRSLNIRVTRPAYIWFAPSPLESEVGTLLTLRVHMADAQQFAFDNCSSLPLVWEVSDESIFTPVEIPSSVSLDSSETRPGICGSRTYRSQREGQAQVTVRYHLTNGEVINATQTLYAFKPLSVVSPRDRALVTLGTSVHVHVEGGPNPWAFDPASHLETLRAEEPKHIRIDKLRHSTPTHRVYLITCLHLGEQYITIEVSNKMSKTLPSPVTVRTRLHFACRLPSTFFLLPETGTKVERADIPLSCPEAITLLPIHNTVWPREMQVRLPTKYQVRQSYSQEFYIAMVDDNGYLFTNFSSLLFDWHISDDSLVTLHPVVSTTAGEPFSVRHRRIFRWAAREGTVTLRLRVTGYDHDMLQVAHIPIPSWHLQWSDDLTKEFDFSLYPNVKLLPAKVSLYNHPDNVISLRAEGGSGYFQVVLNDSSLATIDYQLGTHELQVRPLKSGEVKVTVLDVCLTGSEPSTTSVYISDISKVDLLSREMVMIGERIPLQLQLLDLQHRPFELSQYRFVHCTVQVETETIAVHPADDAANIGSIELTSRCPNLWWIRGVAVGVGRITVTASAVNVTSAAFNISPSVLFASSTHTISRSIHVFPPLRIQCPPGESIPLVPGARYQVTTTGGPPLSSDISFHITNTSVCTVETTLGVLHAISEGKTTLSVQAHIYDRVLSQRVLLTSDSCLVDVHYLSGLRLHVPAQRVWSGTELSVHVEGSQRETPLAWGGFGNAIQFQWSLLDASVLTFLVPSNDSRYWDASIRLRALKQGTTRLSVVCVAGESLLFGPRGTGNAEIISASSPDIVVASPLRLLTPSRLVMATHSHFQIRTNKDSDQYLHYTLLETSDSTVSSSSLLTISPRGLITSHHLLGTAFVLVTDYSETPPVSALVSVTVKLVHMLDLAPLDPVAAAFFPVGSTQRYTVYMRDERGELFHSVDGIALHWQMSELGVVSVVTSDDVTANVTSSTTVVTSSAIFSSPLSPTATGVFPVRVLKLQALRPGHVILELRAHSNTLNGTTATNFIRTYLPLHVTNAINPAAPLVHLGGTVQFTTTFSTDPILSPTPWSVSNENVLTIDRATGLATARQVGYAIVYHNSSVHTFTPVHVVKVSKLLLEAPLELAKSSAISPPDTALVEEGYHYFLPLIIYTSSVLSDRRADSSQGADFVSLVDTPSIRHHFVVRCTSPSPLLFVTNWTHPVTRQHYCIAKLLPPPKGSKIDIRGVTVPIVATLTDSKYSYTVTTERNIPLYSHFKILSGKEVYVAPHSPALIEVQTQQELVVKNSDPTHLSVRRLRHDPLSNSVVYEVRLAMLPGEDYQNLLKNGLFLEFVNVESGQSERVQLVATPPTPHHGELLPVVPVNTVIPSSTYITSWLWAILIITVGLVAAYLLAALRKTTPASTATATTATTKTNGSSPSPVSPLAFRHHSGSPFRATMPTMPMTPTSSQPNYQYISPPRSPPRQLF